LLQSSWPAEPDYPNSRDEECMLTMLKALRPRDGVSWLGLVLIGSAGAWGILAWLTGHAGYATLRDHVFWTSVNSLAKVFWTPWFPILTAATLAVEWWIPADDDQRVVSIGLFHDAAWFCIVTVSQTVFIAAWIGVLSAALRYAWGAPTLLPWQSYPLWLVFIAGVAVVDFLGWFHHWVRHKVPWFWLFHAVHHSQQQLNLFTDGRYHVVEYLVSATIRTTALVAIGIPLVPVIGYELAHGTYTRLYHANIRSNFGWLRYLLVTPQSHRVHHSIEERHRDTNFGVLLSIWDRMFGTQYHGFNEYPRTGVRDPYFPIECRPSALSLFHTLLRQNLYPFKGLWLSAHRVVADPVAAAKARPLGSIDRD
jgi:sterol desaturase/sphingolipid hydroxylase (fatty acid hydroxylase superfamily)